MSCFLLNPNLPNSKVKTVITGKVPESVSDALSTNHIDVLHIDKSAVLSSPVGFHADLQCIHLGKDKILLSNEQTRLEKVLKSKGFSVVVTDSICTSYPLDCKLNVTILNNKIICNKNIIDKSIEAYISENNLEIVSVKQGYSRCAVCVVRSNAIITEDESIKNACEKANIDVLLIRKGFVRLDGYKYGFIGGASFKIDSDTVAFTGNICRHPDFENIKSFLYKHNAKYLCLNEEALTDVGGILPVIQE